MKTLLSICCFLFVGNVMAQKPTTPAAKTTVFTKKIVDVACGECQFKLKGKSCDLSVRIDNKAYFVDGFNIDDFGDAHAKDGFCEAVRKAEVTGTLVNGRFKATAFKLVEEKEKPAIQ